MRILAIRGENLASLAAPFALEFEREPLRSAGLFAITGQTGAGKSTILDALCLALYDEFPRVVAPGAHDAMPDAVGASIKESDPRTILRRGAGRGFAEVDFIARDGRRYRVRCDLARARGKAAGRLQNRGRSLWRLDEAGEILEAVESGVEAVDGRVLELTDLTFDQFRRTALLAQGDFDAFLRAGEKERADLLEKITGAEIYSRLSKRAYERWDDSKRVLAALEMRRAEIGVMGEEERAAILAERNELEEGRARLSAEHKATFAALRRLDALAQAREKHARAEADCVVAAEAFAKLSGERETLADLARVEPLRALRENVRRADAAHAEKYGEATVAEQDAMASRAMLEAAEIAASVASANLNSAKEEIARFLPLWTKAAALDAQIDAQTQEEARACADAQEKALRLADKRADLTKLRAKEQTAIASRDTARVALDALAAGRALSERWPEIDEWLSKRAQFTTERMEASRNLQEALAELERADDMHNAFDAEDETDRAAQVDVLRQKSQREAALQALDPSAAELRLDAAARAYDLLQAMSRACRDHDAAQATAAGARVDLARFGDDAAALAVQLAQLRQTREAQAAQREEAERLGDLADATADAEAARLRQALEDGEPCPVCGATDHPFAHSSDVARELVETLRRKRAAARQALTQTDKEIAEVCAQEAGARARHEDAARRLSEAEAASATAAADYAAFVAQDPHPDAPAQVIDASAKIAALLQGLGAEREALTQIRLTGQRLQADMERLRKAADDRRAAIEARRVARNDAVRCARVAGEKRAIAWQGLVNVNERLESLDRSLSPFLPLCDLSTADLDRDPASARRQFEEAGARFRRARQDCESAEAQCATFIPQIATLVAEERALTEQARTAADGHGARAGALDKIRSARKEVLGGEATTSHRARYEENQKAALATFEASRDALAEAGRGNAACDAHSAAALHAVEAAARAVTASRTAFSAALAAAGFQEEDAAPLLAVSSEDALAMGRTVERARSALDAAEAALEQRRADLAEAQDAGLPEAARETLAAREAELTRALEEFTGKLGALAERLAQDDAARGRSEALSAEAASAAATRKLWDEVSAAIGSKEGDKFRRFAQSVTLEQLVALANRRLALLAPRYMLERTGEMGSLGLQIVDRDLGDERRSTRSLSGGERFLASLALALALAGLEGRDSFVDTLFIDEGFGALDSATLDVVVDALETLQGQGRRVGVISHVESLQSRIATKICVERRGGGVSVVRLRAPGFGD